MATLYSAPSSNYSHWNLKLVQQLVPQSRKQRERFRIHQRCASQTGPAFSLGRRPSPHSRTLTCNHKAIRIPSLPFEWIWRPGTKNLLYTSRNYFFAQQLAYNPHIAISASASSDHTAKYKSFSLWILCSKIINRLYHCHGSIHCIQLHCLFKTTISLWRLSALDSRRFCSLGRILTFDSSDIYVSTHCL